MKYGVFGKSNALLFAVPDSQRNNIDAMLSRDYL